MDNQRKFPDKCCAHCKWCTQQDWFELDGTCEKGKSTDSESGEFTFLDHEACSSFELSDLRKDMRVVSSGMVPSGRFCGNCRSCVNQDLTEMDGSCERRATWDPEDHTYLFLDDKACEFFEEIHNERQDK